MSVGPKGLFERFRAWHHIRLASQDVQRGPPTSRGRAAICAGLAPITSVGRNPTEDAAWVRRLQGAI